MLLATLPPQPQAHLSNYASAPNLPQNYATKYSTTTRTLCFSSSSSTSLRHVSTTEGEADDDSDPSSTSVSSAAAVAAAIRGASTSPVDFVQRIEKKTKALVLPSQDFQRLCVEQLDLFRRIVDSDALLSVYVRPAGSYVMDRLELRRITIYPGVHAADIVVLVGNFSMPAGLRVAEAAILNQQAEFFPELGAVVFPMVTHPFVVGFLVAELPSMALEKEWCDAKESSLSGNALTLPKSVGPQALDVQSFSDRSVEMPKFTTEQKLNAINITRSLAVAYVMDQKAMLLQQSSWQNNIRMSSLVEQIRGSLSSIQTLGKMLSVHLKRSEIAYDIVEDILVQGDYMRDSLQQLQDAVYLTKANIIRYNNEMRKKMYPLSEALQESLETVPSGSMLLESSISKMQESTRTLSISPSSSDSEFPMPPLALAPSHQHGIRPCEISDVLQDLVGAIKPLTDKQQRDVELCNFSTSLKVAVEEPALRQALGNLIEGALLRTEVGGKIEIVSALAPAGGAVVIIDDDGPDMHYMTQMHSLAPFGTDLSGDDRIEDNMTWNFVAGLTVAREILESYGCVIRVLSPRNTDAALGSGGTRLEIWLPSFSDSSLDSASSVHEA